MNRRSFIRSGAFTVGALTIAQHKVLAALQIDPWKITMLRKGVGIFSEKGGTIGFLIGKEDIVVVDTQFPDQSKHLIEELKKQSSNPFKLLINTHHHGDHTGGNIAFKGIVPHVLAHANSKANQERVAKEKKTEDQQLFPDQTFSDTWCEKMGKEEICLHYFGAGHTNGDSLVQFKKANVVHMGDLVFNRRHPFIDRSAGASIKNWITVLDKTVQTFNKKTIYIFGHAGTGYEVTGGKEDIMAFRNYLDKLLVFVGEQIKAGKTKEEILKATEIPGAPEWKGDGIDRPLKAAYEELTAA
jgi:glyoxylase-like metal-dependent hydrolase (beta-lactamase superfamily II)